MGGITTRQHVEQFAVINKLYIVASRCTNINIEVRNIEKNNMKLSYSL